MGAAERYQSILNTLLVNRNCRCFGNNSSRRNFGAAWGRDFSPTTGSFRPDPKRRTTEPSLFRAAVSCSCSR